MKRKNLFLLPISAIVFCMLTGCIRKNDDEATPNPPSSNICVHCQLFQNGVVIVDATPHCGTAESAANWETSMESGGYVCHYD